MITLEMMVSKGVEKRDKMQYNIEKKRKSVPVEKLEDVLEKLRDDIRKLETQVAALSNVDMGKRIGGVEAIEPPHAATAKCQMCKSCQYMRLPHKSNAHHTCTVRHSTIEPTWTCRLYNDKNNQRVLEPVSNCGN